MIVTLMTRTIAALKRDHLRRRTIRELSELNDHMLKDIGLHRGEIAGVAEDLVHNRLAENGRVIGGHASRPKPVYQNAATACQA